MKYSLYAKRRSPWIAVAIIWTAAVLAGIAAYMALTGQLFALSVNQAETATVIGEQYNPQKTISGYKLQPTVSGAYLQWGDNPQKTVSYKVLEDSTQKLEVQ